MLNSMVLGNVLGTKHSVGDSGVVAGVVVAGHTVGSRDSSIGGHGGHNRVNSRVGNNRLDNIVDSSVGSNRADIRVAGHWGNMTDSRVAGHWGNMADSSISSHGEA